MSIHIILTTASNLLSLRYVSIVIAPKPNLLSITKNVGPPERWELDTRKEIRRLPTRLKRTSWYPKWCCQLLALHLASLLTRGAVGPGVKIWHDLLLFRHFHHCMSLLSKKIYLTRNWDLHNFSTKKGGGT